MDKEKLYKAVLEKVKSDLTLAVNAVKTAYESATHEENKAENKYDTKGLEASYLVQGQARRVEELENSLAALNSMKIRNVDKIMLNAFVELQTESGDIEYLFITPSSGGLKINFENLNITLMTPASPLGQALLAKIAGDKVSVKIGPKEKTFQILKVI